MLTLGQKIKILRDYDLSYNKIVALLGCTKSIVSYHIGVGQKEKNYIRAKKSKSNEHPYVNKRNHFLEDKPHKGKYTYPDFTTNEKNRLYSKCQMFCSNGKKGDYKLMFTIEDVINKLGDKPSCYLTGDPIDISKTRSYHFDHIVPRAKGGTNTIDNLGVCTKEANLAKNELTEDQLVELCKKILIHHGFEVNRLSK